MGNGYVASHDTNEPYWFEIYPLYNDAWGVVYKPFNNFSVASVTKTVEVNSIKHDYIYKPLPLDTTDYDLARLDPTYMYHIDDNEGIYIDFDPASGADRHWVGGDIRVEVSHDKSYGYIYGEWFEASWSDDGAGNRIWDWWSDFAEGGSEFDPTELWNAVNNKMDKENPTGTGSFSLNRKQGTTIGMHSVALGSDVEASGGYSHATGAVTKASGYCSHAEGN